MIGQQILHYRIVEEIGRGGMGVVYKAADTRLDRTVAIKFLPKHVAANEVERKRFEIEAKAAASLNHPNIATIHAIEEANDEIFIVMEYIDGRELRDIIARHDHASQPAMATVLNYATQIAAGLQAAHEKGIVHRDIKSANIMVTDKGQIKIMDFGLAKVAGAGVQLTKEHTTLGTAAYMSPEQTRGDMVDHRTDIWAFGIVLYEMLTGQAPFGGDYEQAVVYSILNEAPPELPAEVSQAAPGASAVIGKCLQKNPAERYQSLDNAIADLNSSSTAITAKVDATSPREATSVRGRKTSLYVGLFAVLALVTIVGYFLLPGKQEQPGGRIPLAVADFVNYTGDDELDALSGMLITALEQSRRLSVLSRSRMFDVLTQLGKQDVTFIDENLGREICEFSGIHALVLPEIRKFGKAYSVDVKVLDPQQGQHLFASQVKDEGQEVIPELIDKLAEKVRRELNENETEIQNTSSSVASVTTPNLEAYRHFFKGQEYIDKLDFERAKREFRQAIALDTTFALAYYRLSYAMSWNMEQLAAEPLAGALRHIDRIPEKERYLVRAEQVRLNQGMQAATAVLKKMEEIYPNEKELLFSLGDYAFHDEKYETAIKYFDKVLAIDPNHERTTLHLNDAYQGYYNSAERLVHPDQALKEAIALRKQRPEITLGLTAAIATIQTQLGRFEDAYEELTTFRENAADEHDIINAETCLIAFLTYTGQCKKAQEVIESSVKLASARNDTATFVYRYALNGFISAFTLQDKTLVKEEMQRLYPYRERGDVPFLKGMVAILCGFAGRLTDAFEILREAHNPPAQIQLSRLIGDCDRAAELIPTVKQISYIPDYIKSWCHLGLAQCYYEKSAVTEAANQIKMAGEIPFHVNNVLVAAIIPQLIVTQAKIAEARGQVDDAIKYYEKLLDIWKNADPNLPDLIYAQERLIILKGRVGNNKSESALVSSDK